MSKIIYHYTTIKGLIGIFSNCNSENRKVELRASSSDYMNDPTERVHAVKVLSKILKAIELTGKSENQIAPFFEQRISNSDEKILNWINQYVNFIDHNLIASFSENRDTLPMWSKYADDGNGIAIGFDLDKLKSSLDDSINITEIVYTNGDEYPKNIYDFIEKFHKEKYSTIDLESDTSRLDYVYGLINYFGNIFKNPAYSYEKEVRLIKSLRKYQGQTKYREAKGLIVPYFDMEINSDCVVEIIIGPTKSFIDSKRSIREYIFGTGGFSGDDSIIVNSEIPYR